MPNATARAAPPADAAPSGAFAALEPLAGRLAALDRALEPFHATDDPAIRSRAVTLRAELRGFEPGVTFLGQVKAGKTTLVNALCGWPGLLPADVNPWTSVVTNLHLAPRHRRAERRAAFTFFADAEWDGLVRQGGRIGEIASRAGAADEMAQVRAQLDEMRAKSRARLGARFEMLLGQTHSYDSLDPDLVKRYVSMGDDFWSEAGTSRNEGRFADITRTADLWFAGPDLPMALQVQDTPGVNDTFMIREQITLAGLRGSRLCVVVLSAQQALSSVDLGLIRLISNVRARDIVIFVNRIDELADPAADVPKIRAAIAATLAQFDGPREAEVIFGSAHWAENAVAGTLTDMGEGSAAALMAWAEAELSEDLVRAAPREIIWALSGLPALGRALSSRIEAGAGAVFVERSRAAIANLGALAEARAVSSTPPSSRPADAPARGTDPAALATALHGGTAALSARLDQALAAFDQRAEAAQRTFLTRATGELVKHLDAYGEDEVWTYDPAGLRMLLRSAYTVYASAARKAAAEALDTLAGAAGLEPPPVPEAEAPVTLAQTVALDLKGGWWTRFWRKRRGYEAFAEDFARLIHEETAAMPETLRRDCVLPYAETLRAQHAAFAADLAALCPVGAAPVTPKRPARRA